MWAATSTPIPAKGATARWGRGRFATMRPPSDLSGGFDPRQIHPRLPAPGRRVRARPGRRVRLYRRLLSWMAPCLRACALRQSDPTNVHWTFAFGSSVGARNQGPSPRLTLGGRCVVRTWPAFGSSSPTEKIRGAGHLNQTARPVLLGGFDPRQIHLRLPAPGRRGRIYRRLRKLRTPCPPACAFGQSDPANLHWRFACRVLCQRQKSGAAPAPLTRWPGSSGSRTTARTRSAPRPPVRSAPRGYGRWPAHT
ncbi:MAG: hypothetical protein RLZZ413_542 [Pseudomonadota bacterium]